MYVLQCTCTVPVVHRNYERCYAYKNKKYSGDYTLLTKIRKVPDCEHSTPFGSISVLKYFTS